MHSECVSELPEQQECANSARRDAAFEGRAQAL